MRFVSAQLLRLLRDDLGARRRATQRHGPRLADGLRAIPGVRIAYPVEANAVFPALPRAVIDRLLERYRFYAWDESAGVVRFMCSWQTTPADVDDLIAAVREAVAES